jgi:Yip1 domain
VAHLVDLFLQPSKVFEEQKVKPTFLLPLLIAAAFGIAMTLTYFMRVDPGWFLDHTVASSGSELSSAEIKQMKAVMPSARVMGYIGAVTVPISLALISALLALYFMLAGKVAGTAISFKHGLSLAAWSSLPSVLGVIVALVGALTMSPQTSLESLMLTNFDPLFVQLPADSPWGPLARGFSLLNIWTCFLAALGWKIWGRTGWGQAIVVSLLPYLVIYGGMAAFAMAFGR